MRDNLVTYRKNERPAADQWNIHVALLRAQNAGAGCFVDSMGTYIAPESQRKVEWVWLKLQANLDAKGTANAHKMTWSASANSGDGDYTEETEDTEVRDCSGRSVGVTGEYVLCRKQRSTNGTVWEVMEGGATHHTGTIDADLHSGGSATVTITSSSATVTAYDILLPSATEENDHIASGSLVVIDYNFEEQRWEITGAPGDTCPDPCNTGT
jgi:hypothetical protein